MAQIELLNATVVGRVTTRTKLAFNRRAARDARRPSEILRELIEGYAHPVRPRETETETETQTGV